MTVAEQPLLRIEHVSAGYGRIDVLQDVSMHVHAQEVVAIIGPNGAGKSTVLKTVMGFLKPSEGEIFFDDRPITGLPTHLLVRSGLAYVPQGRVIFPQMTVMENLAMGAFTVSIRQTV